MVYISVGRVLKTLGVSENRKRKAEVFIGGRFIWLSLVHHKDLRKESSFWLQAWISQFRMRGQFIADGGTL